MRYYSTERTDKEAIKRLTVEGTLLPCPFCGKSVAHAGTIAEHEYMDIDSTGYIFASTHFDVVCYYNKGGCGASTGPYESEDAARLAWNTRARIGGDKL